jgi:hypothetical protein
MARAHKKNKKLLIYDMKIIPLREAGRPHNKKVVFFPM